MKKLRKNHQTLVILLLLIIIFTSIPLVLLSYFKFSENHYKVERIYFQSVGSERDNITLSGIIYRPDNTIFSGKRPAVVCLHDFGDSKESMDRFSEDLVRAGYVVLSYDQRGFGNSEGVSHFGSQNHELRDLEMSINYMNQLDYVNESKIGVMGMGYGGSIALMASSLLGDQINSTFAINPYTNLTTTFRNIDFNSIQGNIMNIISKYLGYIPSFKFPNEVSNEEAKNIKGFLDMISEAPAMANIRDFIFVNGTSLIINRSAMLKRSPFQYSSSMPNNSICIASGEENSVYSINHSRSFISYTENVENLNIIYQEFKGEGHYLNTNKLDNLLINYFNVQLLDSNLDENGLLNAPLISETGQILDFSSDQKYFLDENDFLYPLLRHFREYLTLPFLISYGVVLFLTFLFLIMLNYNKSSQDKKKRIIQLKSEKTKPKKSKLKKKSKRIKDLKEKKTEFLDDKKKEKSPDFYIEDIDSGIFSLFENKTLGIFILLITALNLIVIPSIALTYVNYNLLSIWILLILVDIIISLLFFSQFTKLLLNRKKKNPKNKDLINKNRIRTEDNDQKKSLGSFKKIVKFLRIKPFYQILFYVLIIFLSTLISLSFNLITSSSFFSTLISSSIILLITAIILVQFDHKYLNPEKSLSDYGFSKKQIVHGVCLPIYIIQIPLVILIVYSYVLLLPQVFLSKPYSFVYFQVPFIFMYILAFELVFRSLIQNKIRASSFKGKIGEFLIGSLFYIQFVGIFSYLIFSTSYSSQLFFMGILISYSGLFGFVFLIMAPLGTLLFMITRTPLSSALVNTLFLMIFFSIIF